MSGPSTISVGHDGGSYGVTTLMHLSDLHALPVTIDWNAANAGLVSQAVWSAGLVAGSSLAEITGQVVRL